MERLAGLIDGQTMLCVAGVFNVHIGVVEPEDEESIGRFGWGTRNREGRDRRCCINVTFFRSSANKEICDLEAIRRAVIFYLNFVINMPRTMTA